MTITKQGFRLSAIAAILFVAVTVRAQEKVHPANYASFEEHMPGELLRQQLLQLQFESRLSPDALLADWKKRLSYRQKASGLQPLTQGLTFNWEFLGPKNQSGHVSAVNILPDNSLVIGASGGGIWKQDKVGSWTPKTDTFPSLRINCSATSPVNPAYLAMGTGEGFLYLSSDYGATWSISETSPGANIASIAFGLKSTKQIFVGSDYGLKYSIDGGKSWTAVANSYRARAVTLDPSNSNTIYYGRKGLGWPYSVTEIMKSTDGGLNFTSIFKNKHGYWSDVLFGICKDHPQTMWVGLDSAHLYYRSTDGGSSWAQCLGVPWTDSYTNGFWMFAADPHNPDVAFAGGPGLFRTVDGGTSWERVDKNVHADFHTIVFGAGTKAALGCDGGAYVTDDYMAPSPVWNYVSNGLITLEAYNVAGSPDGSNIVITGNQDNGYAKFTGDANKWLIVGGDGFVSLYDKDDPKTFYHEYTNMNLHRATDGFTWWSPKIMDGLPTNSDFYTGIVNRPVDWFGQAFTMDPTNSATLYCGTDSLFKSIDNGDNWFVVGNSRLTSGSALTSIAVSPLNPEVIYTGSSDGIASRSTDGGLTWYRIPKTQFLNQSSRIQSIVCSQRDEQTAYLVMQSNPSTQGVFRTTNGGINWQPITSGLPQVTPTRILEDPEHPDTLILGTSVGLFTSINHGQSWSEVINFPNVYVQDLAWQKLGFPGTQQLQTLLVATYGRGIIRGNYGVSLAAVDSVAFVTTRIGRSRDTTLALLHNPTSVAEYVTGLRTTDSVQFQILSEATSFSLQPGADQKIQIRYSPVRPGVQTAYCTFTSGLSGLQQIRLVGGSRDVSLSAPKSMDFGTRSSFAQVDSELILKLQGDVVASDTINVIDATIIGDDADNFTLNTPFITLPVSGANFSVAFTPQSTGQKTALLQIVSDASNSFDTIVLKGNVLPTSGVAEKGSAEIMVQPNPVANYLSIANLPTSISTVQLVDESGKSVRLSEVPHDRHQMRLDVRDVPSGVYMLRMQTSNAASTERRVVIKH